MTDRAVPAGGDAPGVVRGAEVSVILMVEAESAQVGPRARRERGPGFERGQVVGPQGASAKSAP